MDGEPARAAARAWGIAIRPAAPADIAPLWSMLSELATYEKMEEYLTGSPERLADHLFGRAWPAVECLLAVQRESLVGYALFYGVFSTFWTRPMIWLEDLLVRDSHRGRGVGRALMAELAKIAVERGCARVDWAVLDWNQPAIDFYERLGATRHGGWHAYRISGAPLEALAREAGGSAP